MILDFVTKDDLQLFRKQLMSDIEALLNRNVKLNKEPVEGYKTRHVRQILGCSVNKLVSLRVSRKIRVKKVGGTLYYNKEDVRRLVEEGF